jgi:hypothetical protein
VISKMPGLRVLVVLGLCAGLAACGGGSSSGQPAPASALRLDGAATVTRTIGPAGGSMSTTATDGTNYALTVPPGALSSATDVTLAPVVSIAGLPPGVSLAAGAHLTPEGQTFSVPVNLLITLAGPPASVALPIAYSGDAQNPQAYPATTSGSTIEFQIVHFSGYAALLSQDAIGLLMDPSYYLPPPGAAGDLALQQVVHASLTLTGEARADAMRSALQGWLDGVIKPAVAAAQAIAAIDVNPPFTDNSALAALTRLRHEMQVFDIAFKYAYISGGSGMDALYDDFRIAVRDSVKHAIPLFNAACDTTTAPILLAVPDILAWQQLAQYTSAVNLEPALSRAAVLDALCVQVAYDPNGGTDFPAGIVPGQTGTLSVRAGYSVNGGPVRFDEPMFMLLTGMLAPFAVAAADTLQQQFLWEPATTEMRIGVEACLAQELVREICQQAVVVRGTPTDTCPSYSATAAGVTRTSRDFSDGAGAGGSSSTFFASATSVSTNQMFTSTNASDASATATVHYTVRDQDDAAGSGPFSFMFVWEGTPQAEAGMATATIEIKGVTRSATRSNTTDRQPWRLEVPVTLALGEVFSVTTTVTAVSTAYDKNTIARGLVAYDTLHSWLPAGLQLNPIQCQ